MYWYTPIGLDLSCELTYLADKAVIDIVLRQIVIGFLRKTAVWHLPPDLVPGDLCSIKSMDGQYAVAQILPRHSKTLTLCIYKERFRSRPDCAEPAELTMPDPDAFGMRFISLSHSAFGTWMPIRIHKQSEHSSNVIQIQQIGRNKRSRLLAS